MSRSTRSRRKRKAVARGATAIEKRTDPAPAPVQQEVLDKEVLEDRGSDGRNGSEIEGKRGSCMEVSSAVLRQVGLEVLREDWEPVSWAQALVEGNGSRDDTLSRYARFRVGELTEKEGDRSKRKMDFDDRHEDRFQDTDSVSKVPPLEGPRWDVLACVDTLFWHLVAMVAGAGTLIGANLLWPGFELGVSWVVVVVTLPMIPLVIWRMGRGGRFKISYAQAAQMAACFAVFGSVVVGCCLLTTERKYQSAIAGYGGGGSRDALPASHVDLPDVTRFAEPLDLDGSDEAAESVTSPD